MCAGAVSLSYPGGLGDQAAALTSEPSSDSRVCRLNLTDVSTFLVRYGRPCCAKIMNILISVNPYVCRWPRREDVTRVFDKRPRCKLQIGSDDIEADSADSMRLTLLICKWEGIYDLLIIVTLPVTVESSRFILSGHYHCFRYTTCFLQQA